MSTTDAKAEAEHMADAIVRMWAKQGFRVRAEVQREPWVEGVNTPGWCVRTNLVNGLPPDHPGVRKIVERRNAERCRPPKLLTPKN